jgi:glycosyltransferase involved in cell wall biosynthesis
MHGLSLMSFKSVANTKVTIGLCVRNSEKTVEKTIYSIINQRYPKELLQLIVVDGCSEDKTISILNRLISKVNLHAEIYSDNGRGLGVARQIVVANAKGKYLIFIGADVELLDDFLQKQVEFLQQNPQVGISAGRHMYKKGGLISAVWSLHNYAVKFGYDALVCRFDAVKQVGGFDEQIRGAAEDQDLIMRIKAKGWTIAINDEARFYHACRENLRDFWNEQAWYGYGSHYLDHKTNNTVPLWRNIPAGSFIHGLKLSLQAYESTRERISFLIPLQMVFGNVAWWFGYLKSHLNGYGHIEVTC